MTHFLVGFFFHLDDPCKIKCITSDSRTPQKVIPSVNVYDGTACSTKTITGVCYQGKCKVMRRSSEKLGMN